MQSLSAFFWFSYPLWNNNLPFSLFFERIYLPTINPHERTMDTDTLVLLVMLFAVFCWWFKLRLDENKEYSREFDRLEKARKIRDERVRQLTNRH
jgi:hypothetical protein